MFSAFFGNYLLNIGLVKPKQLSQILEKQSKTRLKLGMLAINSGYLNAEKVNELHELQASKDMRFGDLAISKGYLTSEQLDELLKQQKLEHLILAQTLIDDDIMTMDVFESAIATYKEAHQLSDEQFEALKENNVEMIVHAFIAFEGAESSKIYSDYVALFLKNIIRFIDSNIRIDRVEKVDALTYDHLVRQSILGDPNLFTAIGANEKAFIALASKYAEEDFDAIDDYPIDAVGEFLNLHNGLFTVNMSNTGVELKLDIQSYIESPTLNPSNQLYMVPIYTSIGTINLIIGQL